MSEVIGTGLFALAAAILAISYQYWQFRKQLQAAKDDAIAGDKKTVIGDLIAYRFVLLSDRRNDPEPTMRFNAALSAIPVHFSNNKACMDKYRSIGDSFTAEKYYELVVELMKDVPLGTESYDRHLLENVPSVHPKSS